MARIIILFALIALCIIVGLFIGLLIDDRPRPCTAAITVESIVRYYPEGCKP